MCPPHPLAIVSPICRVNSPGVFPSFVRHVCTQCPCISNREQLPEWITEPAHNQGKLRRRSLPYCTSICCPYGSAVDWSRIVSYRIVYSRRGPRRVSPRLSVKHTHACTRKYVHSVSTFRALTFWIQEVNQRQSEHYITAKAYLPPYIHTSIHNRYTIFHVQRASPRSRHRLPPPSPFAELLLPPTPYPNPHSRFRPGCEVALWRTYTYILPESCPSPAVTPTPSPGPLHPLRPIACGTRGTSASVARTCT